MAGMIVTAVTLVACLAALVQSSSGASYTVGGSSGWNIPSSNSLYTSWVTKQTFKVGDVLVFNFQTGQHTVAEVSKADYDACSSTKPISTASTGPASVTIKTAGAHYYICTVANHCSVGQKLAITTASSSSASPTSSSSADSPSPSVSTTPSAESPAEGPGSAAAPPSASSAAVSAAAGLVLPTLVAAAAYLF